ncbi:MAG: PaaX family transcriptional regulator C-terminal domain-containing protein [Pseudomonadota bacterium]
MQRDEFTDICRGLRDLGGQRVWSLLVTLFGDLASAPGATLSGPALASILQGIDVRPEAMRVSLHRLRKDEWILSEKSGRESHHRLSARGRQETQVASRRIYSRSSCAGGKWYVAITDAAAPDPLHAMMSAGYVQIQNRVYAGENPRYAPKSALILQGDTAPDWLREALVPISQKAGYAALCALLEQADEALTDATRYSVVDRATIRCLVVHNWRRLVLKHPDLPPTIFPDGWRGEDCRHLVHRLLDRFPRPKLSEIDMHAAPANASTGRTGRL